MNNKDNLILCDKGYKIYIKYGWIEFFAIHFNNIVNDKNWELDTRIAIPSVVDLALCNNVYSFVWKIKDESKSKKVSVSEVDIYSKFITTGFNHFGKIFEAINSNDEKEKLIATKIFKTYIRIYGSLKAEDRQTFGKEIINGLNYCNIQTVNEIDINILKGINQIVRPSPEIVDYIYIFDNYHKDNDAIIHEFLNLLQDEERFKIILNMYKYASKLDKKFFEYNLISSLSIIKTVDEIKEFMEPYKELKDIRKFLSSIKIENNEIHFNDKYLLDKNQINVANLNSALTLINNISGEKFKVKTKGALKVFNEKEETPKSKKILNMLYKKICLLGCLLDTELSEENLALIRNDILIICGEEIHHGLQVKRKKI